MKRTGQQRKAIEVYCRELAKAMNDSGQTMQKVMEIFTVDIDWSQETVKELMWKRLQNAMFNVDSTTKLETDQVSEVYETLNRYTAEKLGLSVPFPSDDHMGDL